MIESLLSLPTIDLRIQDNAGFTALMIAIQFSSNPDGTIIVQKLIAYVQARPEYNTTAAKWHPIFNAQDNDGLTPLHWAVRRELHDCISTLLDTRRVDVDLKASNGNTAAMLAIPITVQHHVLELLFDRRACDPTVRNERGEALVGVARRLVRESSIDYWGGHLQVARDKLARDKLHLCEDYASHYDADLQVQAIGPPVAAGPRL